MWCGNIAHNGTCGVGCEEDWASHFLEHEISAIYNVTHGAGLSVVFPAWMTWMTEHNVDKIAQYAVRVWNVSEADNKKAVALEGIARLKSFFKSDCLLLLVSWVLRIPISTVWQIVCIGIKENW